MPHHQPPILDIAAAPKLTGFKSLRPGQQEAIDALVNGRDVVLVQPTGSGKSTVYQIAGTLLAGSTVVVSPPIALEKDQAGSMDTSGLEPRAAVDSMLSIAEQSQTLERIEHGHIEQGKGEYIFLAPEQLRKEETLEHLRQSGISLIAVDEAHCISQWGHDFQPDYLLIAAAIEALGHPPVLAMTASASREVRTEIVERLGLHNPRVLVNGFDRPNISLRVDTFSSQDEKEQSIVRRIEFADKPGIVYVATHKNAETIAADLNRAGIPADFYHGGLRPRQREEVESRFMRGQVPVIVATNALGMGVDRPDVRFVYHADVADSLDGYYQEIGRAGRDGQPAEAVLFYRPQDISAQQFKTGPSHIDSDALEAVYNALRRRRHPISRHDLAEASGIPPRKLAGVLQKLEDSGAAHLLETGEVEAASKRPLAEIIDEASHRQQLQKEIRKQRLQKMQQYAEWRSCRREYLLRYFGDDYQGPCGNCDRCEANGVLKRAA